MFWQQFQIISLQIVIFQKQKTKFQPTTSCTTSKPTALITVGLQQFFVGLFSQPSHNSCHHNTNPIKSTRCDTLQCVL
jgi:hypothetical protein